jgi:hypothetical protein
MNGKKSLKFARLGCERIKFCRKNEGIKESCFTRRLECSYYAYIVDYKNAGTCEDVTYLSESMPFVLLGTDRCSTSL